MIRTVTPLADGDAREAEAKARANAERAGERMRKLNADPEFARANAEAVSQAQKKRWAEFRRKRALEES